MTPDEARLEHLARTHAAPVLAYLVRRVNPREDAADIWQLTLTTVWRKIHQAPDRDEEALPWLIAVARGELANYRRGQFRRLAATQRLRDELATAPPRGGSAGPPAAYGVGSRTDHDGPGERVREALAHLGATDREIVTLTYWDGLTAEQVGLVVGLRAAAVRKRLQRARQRLTVLLAEPESVEPERQGAVVGRSF
ncbi:MAG TPA: sigma-70 family RNA polymerase sigma factor [Phycicoccus sp.]|nr:sigma-70 family RNA polymerase sigma factor [Phycicoccus sp.]